MTTRLKDTLLLIGDADSDRSALRDVFAHDYNLLEAENIAQATVLFEQNGSCIAAVLADVSLDLGEEIRAFSAVCRAGNDTPLMFLVTPVGTGEREAYAFTLGATDVVLKPYTRPVIQKRVEILTNLYLHKCQLERLVEEKNTKILRANQIMLDALSAIIEHRSSESGNHVLRIRRFTKILLEEVARNCPEYGLDERSIDVISSAAVLHDIGKISIPDAILNCPDKLSEEEFEVIKTHAAVGGRLIRSLSGIGDGEFLQYAYDIAMYHHERWDGRGYPCGLVGSEIPISAQVVSIADAFDALTTDRAYKEAIPYKKAFNMILNGECGAFSPQLLECFKHVAAPFMELARRYADGYSPSQDSIPIPEKELPREPVMLDSQQMSQIKYQTLLHYVNDTVMELDVDNQLYHVVYNPNPDLEALVTNASFEEISQRLMQDGVHPLMEDSIRDMREHFSAILYRQNMRRHSFRCNIFSRSLNCSCPYEVTLLRISTIDPGRRLVIAVFHKLTEETPAVCRGNDASLCTDPMLQDLLSSPLRCLCSRAVEICGGGENLLPLTGFTPEEIRERFGNSLMEMVIPEDRPQLEEMLRKVENCRSREETGFRIFRRGAAPLWVLGRARAHLDGDGRDCFYLSLTDIQYCMEQQQKLEENARIHQMVIDQSESIVFEWDLAADELRCSEKWEQRFGYAPISGNFGERVLVASHFHPDDLALLRAGEQALRADGRRMELDVRIANVAGGYLWNKICADVLRDREGRIVKIVGTVTDIDDLKKAALNMKEQAERDALTKLLNKASTQQLISNHLASREADSTDAMLIIDLDNFKSINDTYGHLYGDAVLTQIGGHLRRLFRSHDIVGRIGGDEFLIFMKQIPDREMVVSRCEVLLSTFRNIMEETVPGLNVSCSIGAVLTPEHGVSYSELFQRADKALYLAKNNGKNCWRIYDSRVRYNIGRGNSANISTRIDSDRLPGLANNSFLHFVFRSLYESTDLPATIDEILAFIGEQFNVSRAYIFENNEDNSCCTNTFEWCNEGITPEKENLSNISYETDIPGWPEVYNEKGVFYCTNISELAPQFRAILEPQGIKSMLQCAIMDNGVFRGYVGFDECTAHRLWTQEQISILEFLAEILALFLLKKRTQDRAVEQAANFRHVLDCQDVWIYVVDPETYELRFLNKKLHELVPKAQLQACCYKALAGRDTPCEGCPIAEKAGESRSRYVRNDHLGVGVSASSAAISWNGSDARLITCLRTEELLPEK